MQAMDLISVAQRTGEVSADAYSEAYHEANGVLPPPQMVGIEEMVERMQLAEADSNPFASGGSAAPANKAVDGAYAGAPSPGPGGQFRPPAIIPPAPSPPRSVVSLTPFLHLHDTQLCVAPAASRTLYRAFTTSACTSSLRCCELQ